MDDTYGFGAIEPIKERDLTEEDIENVLPSHINKKNGADAKIKARWVVNGNHQSGYGIEDTFCPTVNTESIFIISAWAAFNNFLVASIDFPGAFLNAKIPEDWKPIHVRLSKDVAERMRKIDGKYRKYLKKNGTIVVRLKKAVYGCKTSGKLWFDILTLYMRSMGFESTKNDPCVFTKRDAKFGTIIAAVHVDDMKIWAETEEGRKWLTETITTDFKHTGKLKVQIGPVIEYLGMVFE